MLAAELHGKTSDDALASQRSEDVLTSYVFSLFRYVDNLRVPVEWLRLARNLAGKPLPLHAVDSASVAFWPTVMLHEPVRYREPDVVLALRDSRGHEVVLVVEAKFHAGLSNQAQQPEVALGPRCASEWRCRCHTPTRSSARG